MLFFQGLESSHHVFAELMDAARKVVLDQFADRRDSRRSGDRIGPVGVTGMELDIFLRFAPERFGHCIGEDDHR